MGVSEGAAKVRLSRAVGRLGAFFKRRGVTIGAAALVMHVETRAVQSAPTHLAQIIKAVSMGSTATASASALAIAGGAMAVMNFVRIKAVAALVLLTITLAGAGAIAAAV